MDVDHTPGLAQDTVFADLAFGDGDQDFLAYCATYLAEVPTPGTTTDTEPATEAAEAAEAEVPAEPAVVADTEPTVEPAEVDTEPPAEPAEDEVAAEAAEAGGAEDAVVAEATGAEVVAAAGVATEAEDAVVGGSEAGTAVEVVESWEGFLLSHGVSWSGDDELWGPFRHWFAHHAAMRGYGDQAAAFLESMDHQADRVRAFSWHGVPVTRPVEVPRQQVDPARCPYDHAAWTGYLDGRGTTWDGSADTWPGFRAAFLAGAKGLGLTIPAAAFVDYVDSQPDRVTVFQRYGLLPVTPATRKPSPRPRPRPAEADMAAATEARPTGTTLPAPGPATPTTATGPAANASATGDAPAPAKAARACRKPAARKPAVRNVSGTVKPPRARSSSRRTAA